MRDAKVGKFNRQLSESNRDAAKGSINVDSYIMYHYFFIRLLLECIYLIGVSMCLRWLELDVRPDSRSNRIELARSTPSPPPPRPPLHSHVPPLFSSPFRTLILFVFSLFSSLGVVLYFTLLSFAFCGGLVGSIRFVDCKGEIERNRQRVRRKHTYIHIKSIQVRGK